MIPVYYTEEELGNYLDTFSYPILIFRAYSYDDRGRELFMVVEDAEVTVKDREEG